MATLRDRHAAAALLSAALLSFAAGPSLAQGGSTNLGVAQRALQLKAQTASDLIPDFGYVVYDSAGSILKAFGPDTPVELDPAGSITILGAQLPLEAVVRTEDGPTFIKALASVSAPEAEDSDYTKTLKDVVNSINEGAEYVAQNLCPRATRPAKITVEIVGGFDFYVHGSVTSTVDWDLDKMCPELVSANPP